MLPSCTPWPEELASLYRRKGYWEDVPIPQLFASLASATPDRIAIIHGARRLTLGTLWQQSIRLAAHFHKAGLRSRQRVVFQMPNSAEFVTTFLALVRIGAIPIMALPPHRETEILHYVNAAEARALLIPDRIKDFDFRLMADSIRAKAKTLDMVFVLGQAREHEISLTELAATEPAAADNVAVENVALEPSDVALMLLSGGTTALPKLIPRTHNDYTYNFKQSARIARFDEHTVLLVVLPMGHNYTLGSPGVLGALANGGRIVIAPKPDCETVFALVESERVTIIPAAVPLVVNWLNDAALQRFNVTSLEVVQNGGARLSPELRERLRKRLNCQFQEVFGTAEGLLNFTRLDDDEHMILHSSGAPMCEDDEIKVLDEMDREVADGERGELVTRGPYTIHGYYNAAQINARAFTADGFYRMGDIVTKRGRHVFAEGRRGDLINRGGEKISVDEVENLILRHPAIHGVALVAMPDPVFGERACAFVTLRPEATLSFQQLIQFLLEQNIAKFKLPERLEILPELPVSAAGKIMRRALRELIEAKLKKSSPEVHP
jgi:2,3-dihydroxybenzoate-AMP ligase